jgi:hypothetical protein
VSEQRRREIVCAENSSSKDGKNERKLIHTQPYIPTKHDKTGGQIYFIKTLWLTDRLRQGCLESVEWNGGME